MLSCSSTDILPEGMKARVSPVQSIEPDRILAPTRKLNQGSPGPQSTVVTTILVPLHRRVYLRAEPGELDQSSRATRLLTPHCWVLTRDRLEYFCWSVFKSVFYLFIQNSSNWQRNTRWLAGSGSSGAPSLRTNSKENSFQVMLSTNESCTGLRSPRNAEQVAYHPTSQSWLCSPIRSLSIDQEMYFQRFQDIQFYHMAIFEPFPYT